MPQESRTPSMGRKTPKIVIQGIEDVIKRDLDKHKSLLERSRTELLAFKRARSHEIKKKRAWNGHIGGGKYNDESLRVSLKQINVNIRHFSDKATMAEANIAEHTRIVDHLTAQLSEQERDLDILDKFLRESKKDASNN